LQHSSVAEPDTVPHLEQTPIVPQPVVLVVGAQPVDQPHDRPDRDHHGGNAQPDVGREGVDEEGVLGEVAGAAVHEGVGLDVDGLGEVDHLHPGAVDGEGGGGQHDFLPHDLEDHAVPLTVRALLNTPTQFQLCKSSNWTCDKEP
jgi:hypothetical protein